MTYDQAALLAADASGQISLPVRPGGVKSLSGPRQTFATTQSSGRTASTAMDARRQPMRFTTMEYRQELERVRKVHRRRTALAVVAIIVIVLAMMAVFVFKVNIGGIVA